jgi:predicted nucleic acid-binding Zn ribbon protein
MSIRWSKEDISFIKENNKKFTLVQFSILLNRTEKAVKLKINRAGLSSCLENKEIKTCLNCGSAIYTYIENGKVFCNSSCSATFNNKYRIRKDARSINFCNTCGNSTKHAKFCSTQCSNIFKKKWRYDVYLSNQEAYCNEKSSIRFIKPFLLEEQNNSCCICKIPNIWENKPLMFILDHIDGNSSNNLKKNLRLVCSNCDSQLDTYKSKNRGKGRFYRKQRMLEGKSF